MYEGLFFGFHQTNEYFPTLHYTEEHIPVGTSKPYCLHLEWIRKEQRQLIDRYYHVQQFPDCIMAKNPKSRWQATDPKTGLDFNVWRQSSTAATYESECGEGATFIKRSDDAPGRCFKYEVAVAICVEIAYVEHPDTASYTWDYVGGCFPNGEYVLYQTAVIGDTYTFDNIPIEVHQSSASIVAEVTNTTGISTSSMLFWIFFLCFIAGAVLLALQFKDQIQEIQNRYKDSRAGRH